jgi:DNA-binding NarL/FixJ family response regulator
MRVIVADDTVLIRQGVVHLLTSGGAEVVAQAGDARSLLRLVETERPDCVVVDIRMPPTYTDEGLVAATEVLAHHQDVGVLVLSQYLEANYVLRLINDRPQGVGYLLKERVLDESILIDALARIHAGETVVDPEVVAQLLGRRRTRDPLESLTPREREVLGLVAQGLSNRAIAERLVVAERTVEAHMTRTFQKLDISEDATAHRRVLAVLTNHRGAPSTP